MESHFTKGYTSLLRVIPASRSASPAKEKEQKILDTFGRILKESSRQYSLFGVSSRTLEDTLVLDSQKFIEAYEIWVTRLRRDCLRRQSAVRHTDVSDCLSWPTINVDGQHNRKGASKNSGNGLSTAAKQWPTPANRDYRNQHAENSKAFFARQNNPRGVNLVEFMQRQCGLLDQDSPSTNGKSRGLWTTPSKDDTNPRKGRYKQGGTALNTQTKGKLNPDWVEQLMGLEAGWTDLGYWETG